MRSIQLALLGVMLCVAPAAARETTFVGKPVEGFTPKALEKADKPIKVGTVEIRGHRTDVLCDRNLRCTYTGPDGQTQTAQAKREKKPKTPRSWEIHIPTPLGPIIIKSEPKTGGGDTGGDRGGEGAGGAEGGGGTQGEEKPAP